MQKLINKTKKAFTLIEMVIVLFIISLLLLVMIPNLGSQKSSADAKSEEAFKTTLQTEVDMYAADKGIESSTNWNILAGNGYITQKQADKANKKYEIKKTPESTSSHPTYEVTEKPTTAQK